ncbi:hypothetical protein J3R83DRAFT_3720 [Lanmaoa asiatica]|nr:hypothetical protein J3R83DRAFT_3720 [Lanmaoa asiatica]
MTDCEGDVGSSFVLFPEHLKAGYSRATPSNWVPEQTSSMASSSVHERLRHVKTMVERAARQSSAAGPARRDAFQELIALTHTSHPLLKSYAAGHIHVFFNDFPDLEEDAINAVYDLCEDLDSKVRMDGYHAVTQVSSVQRKWVKRNADVLVQLLQSGELEEVAVIKIALLKHLDMDPPVTLGVLCDQIVPPEEDLDDDERQTRERLRSLVLSFLATDAMSAIQKYTDPPGSEAEHVLVAQLILSCRSSCQEDRIRVITWIMDVLSVSERNAATQTQQIAQLRRQIVDASSILLEVLVDSKLYRDDLWHAVRSILRNINTRKELENWILPPYLITSISKVLQVLPCGQTREDASEIQDLIRLLAGEQPSSSQAPTQEVKPTVKIGITLERPAHLPQRPVTGPPPPLATELDLSMTWSAIATQQSPLRDNTSRHFHISSVPMSPKRSGSSSEDVPRTKRVKMSSRGQDFPTPSLLSRIADAGDANSGGFSDRNGKRRRKRSGKELSPEPDRHPSIGYSIKGAANAQRNGSGSESSLLDRM